MNEYMPNNKIYNTITQISVGRASENPVYGECIRIKIEDECGGMFLVFEQDNETHDVQTLRVGFDEWENICKAVSVLRGQPLVK